MRTMRKAMVVLVVVAVALCLPAGRTWAQPANAMDAMINGAKTAADHEALAAQYDKEAALPTSSSRRAAGYPEAL